MATSERSPYLSATVLDQAFLDECQDNLTSQLEMVADIDSPVGMLHFSDRNKYVGDTFYEARCQFPVIQRTLGDFLQPQLQFSDLQIQINNVDGKYNNLMPGGADFDGWIGRSIEIRMGLRDVESTYTTIFKGTITDQAGFGRTRNSFILIARDQFDKLQTNFPRTLFTLADYPDIELEFENTAKPYIYGDWTVNVQENAASVPAIVVNGNNGDVNGDNLDIDDNPIHNQLIRCVISENANVSFDTSSVFVLRNDFFYPIAPADIVNVNADNNYFEIRQAGTSPAGVTTIGGEPFKYQRGEKFYVRVVGKILGGGSYNNNIVAQARDILETFAGAVGSDFDSTWNALRDKSTPLVSNIMGTQSRVWVAEPISALDYVLSMLNQVRVEMFVSRELKLSLRALHLDTFVANGAFILKNWDLESGSLSLNIDETKNFNRAQASFNFLPNRNENYQETKVYVNNAAIAQAGKEISKRVVFPNLHVENDVINNLIEILRISSSYIEQLQASITWRGLLLDIGQFVRLNMDIQAVQFSMVPGLIRDIGYDPAGIKLPIKIWSMQMLPFPGYNPAFPGTVGGNTATITIET